MVLFQVKKNKIFRENLQAFFKSKKSVKIKICHRAVSPCTTCICKPLPVLSLNTKNKYFYNCFMVKYLFNEYFIRNF